MNAGEMIEQLKEFDPKMEVAILDGFNGGGQPRTINLGPHCWDLEVLEDMKSFDQSPDYADIKTPSGTPIIVIGYGCY